MRCRPPARNGCKIMDSCASSMTLHLQNLQRPGRHSNLDISNSGPSTKGGSSTGDAPQRKCAACKFGLSPRGAMRQLRRLRWNGRASHHVVPICTLPAWWAGRCVSIGPMLLCSSCNAGWHCQCLSPPLPSPPEDEHCYCPTCTELSRCTPTAALAEADFISPLPPLRRTHRRCSPLPFPMPLLPIPTLLFLIAVPTRSLHLSHDLACPGRHPPQISFFRATNPTKKPFPPKSHACWLRGLLM